MPCGIIELGQIVQYLTLDCHVGDHNKKIKFYVKFILTCGNTNFIKINIHVFKICNHRRCSHNWFFELHPHLQLMANMI